MSKVRREPCSYDEKNQTLQQQCRDACVRYKTLLYSRCSNIAISENTAKWLYGHQFLSQQLPKFGILGELTIHYTKLTKFPSDVHLPAVNNKVDGTIEHNQEVTKCHHYVHPMAPGFRRVFTFNRYNQEEVNSYTLNNK